MKKVSIILPIYNAQETIEETIESILQQTYKNFELIAINDGSEDNSHKICKKIAKKDERIKYYYRENKGVSYTRNEAIKFATGDYIMFIDADDKYKNDAIESIIQLITKYDLVIFGYERINNKDNRKVLKTNSTKEYDLLSFEELIIEMQKNNLFNQIWNKIYSTELIKKNKISFDESLSLGEDFKFVLDYLSKCKKVLFDNKILYSYTNGTEGLNQKFRKDKLKIRTENSIYLWNYFEQNNYNLNHVYHDYILSCASGLKNISNIKDKKIKKREIENYINSDKIRKKLEEIKKNSLYKKDKIIAALLLSKSVIEIKFLIYILSKIDKHNKKKLGY